MVLLGALGCSHPQQKNNCDCNQQITAPGGDLLPPSLPAGKGPTPGCSDWALAAGPGCSSTPMVTTPSQGNTLHPSMQTQALEPLSKRWG